MVKKTESEIRAELLEKMARSGKKIDIEESINLQLEEQEIEKQPTIKDLHDQMGTFLNNQAEMQAQINELAITVEQLSKAINKVKDNLK